jgi:hypothetical protein
MNKKYSIYGPMALSLILLVGIGTWYCVTQYGSEKVVSPSDIATSSVKYTTYKNEVFGYSVEYMEQATRQNVWEGGFSDETMSVHNIVTFERHTEKNISQVLGSVYCTNGVVHNVWDTASDNDFAPGLRVDMSLREYAQAFFDDKVARGHAWIRHVRSMNPDTIAGQEAFEFMIAEETDMRYEMYLDVNRYIVTENMTGNKCIIRYPVYDRVFDRDSSIYEARQHWLNSFKWNMPS